MTLCNPEPCDKDASPPDGTAATASDPALRRPRRKALTVAVVLAGLAVTAGVVVSGRLSADEHLRVGGKSQVVRFDDGAGVEILLRRALPEERVRFLAGRPGPAPDDLFVAAITSRHATGVRLQMQVLGLMRDGAEDAEFMLMIASGGGALPVSDLGITGDDWLFRVSTMHEATLTPGQVYSWVFAADGLKESSPIRICHN